MKDASLTGRTPQVFAVEYIRALRGGSKPILCRASDGHFYAVKFLNNPQGRRCVVNDLFASLLAREIGLPVPQPALVRVTTDFVKRSGFSPEQTKALGDCEFHFGSRVPVNPNERIIFNVWPKHSNVRIANAGEAVGCWLFDAWTSNPDGFQYVIHRQSGRSYRFWRIDLGFCFMANLWTFHDSRLYSGGWEAKAMQSATKMADFEPYLSRIKSFPLGRFRRIAASIPRAWLGTDVHEFEALVFCLHIRKALLEGLIAKRWPSHRLGALAVSDAAAATWFWNS